MLLYENENSHEQEFDLIKLDNSTGFFMVKFVHGDLCLGVAGNDRMVGACAVHLKCNSKEAGQQWKWQNV